MNMGRKKLSKRQARRLAILKNSKMTKEQRRAHAIMMNQIRWSNRKLEVKQ